jgi:hypothetical protein
VFKRDENGSIPTNIIRSHGHCGSGTLWGSAAHEDCCDIQRDYEQADCFRADPGRDRYQLNRALEAGDE